MLKMGNLLGSEICRPYSFVGVFCRITAFCYCLRCPFHLSALRTYSCILINQLAQPSTLDQRQKYKEPLQEPQPFGPISGRVILNLHVVTIKTVMLFPTDLLPITCKI
jgi:hypothetical protein